MHPLSPQQVAELVGGRLEEGGRPVTGINTLNAAGPDEASFLSNRAYRPELAHTRAGLLLLGEQDEAPAGAAIVRVSDPYLAFAKLQRYFHPDASASGRRHPSASIHPDAELADDVDVGAQAVIGAGCRVGPGCRIGPGCVVEERAVLGANCRLHARAVVCHDCVLGDDIVLQCGAVVGADGFGYAWSGSEHLKIPQVGRVILKDGVEVGANTCIDRGAIQDTVIGRGVKLDNLMQIGHNVEIGDYTIMAGLTAIAGSTTIGRGCQIGGHAAIAGHLKIGDGCRISGKAGVISDLEAGGSYAGNPAMPQRLWFRVASAMRRLPELVRRLEKDA